MSYDSYFDTSIRRDGAKYVARYDGEYCGHHETMQKAKDAMALRRKVEKLGQELDSVSRRLFCNGRYGVWRAIERGDTLPSDIEEAFNRHHAATMAFQKAIGRA